MHRLWPNRSGKDRNASSTLIGKIWVESTSKNSGHQVAQDVQRLSPSLSSFADVRFRRTKKVSLFSFISLACNGERLVSILAGLSSKDVDITLVHYTVSIFESETYVYSTFYQYGC